MSAKRMKMLETLKWISQSGFTVIANSEIKDVSWRDYLIFSTLDGKFSVYNLEFGLDDVESIVIDTVEIRIHVR